MLYFPIIEQLPTGTSSKVNLGNNMMKNQTKNREAKNNHYKRNYFFVCFRYKEANKTKENKLSKTKTK